MRRADIVWLVLGTMMLSAGFYSRHWILFLAGFMVSVYALTADQK